MDNNLERRSFLKFVGLTASATLAPAFAASYAGSSAPREFASIAPSNAAPGLWIDPNGKHLWMPPAYPVPLPGDGGSAASDLSRLSSYVVNDDLTLPEHFTYDVIVSWGDVIRRANGTFRFGFNADYTGLIPIPNAADEYILVVNHEYISGRPFNESLIEDGIHDDRILRIENGNSIRIGDTRFDGTSIDLTALNAEHRHAIQAHAQLGMDALGVSTLHVRQDSAGRFRVVQDSDFNRNVSGYSSVGFRSGAPTLTGPATHVKGIPVDAPPRTFANCSGTITPWGTMLTCEENFQDQIAEFVAPDGTPLNPSDSNPMQFRCLGVDASYEHPFEYLGLAAAADPSLDPRSFGWVVEIDPIHGTCAKHSALGRFRHENVSLRCEAHQTLAAYMGDDRRGGHVWKYLSAKTVTDPSSHDNAALFEDGTLCAAQFHDDYTGTWIPLRTDTPLRRPQPHHCADGFVWLPRLPEGGHLRVRSTADSEVPGDMTTEEWIASVEEWAGKAFDAMTLGDLVIGEADDAKLGSILLQAHAMANAAGATPTARPEDVEVHPIDHSVYIAFTDSTGSGDGSPDARIFPDSNRTNTRQYGAVYRLEERPATKGNSMQFVWGRFISSGETADGGGGFACADNLAFDDAGNLWMVTDITTMSHNFPVDRERRASAPGESRFTGVFGNNALFCIPTQGEHAGVPQLFAIGPMECEMTGPTITPDASNLLIAVQHPGELNGMRGSGNRPDTEERLIRVAGRDGTVIDQKRTVPIGSRFPHDATPRPCVVQIRHV